jgi:hypothetical protein
MLSRRCRRSLRGKGRRSAPVEPQEIKRHVGGRPRTPQELVELRAPGRVGRNQLAVENGLVDGELGSQLLTEGGEAIEDIAAP